jgi:hypothetical protein
MAVATDDLVARVLAAAEPAERSLRRQMLDVSLAPAQPAALSSISSTQPASTN